MKGLITILSFLVLTANANALDSNYYCKGIGSRIDLTMDLLTQDDNFFHALIRIETNGPIPNVYHVPNIRYKADKKEYDGKRFKLTVQKVIDEDTFIGKLYSRRVISRIRSTVRCRKTN
jgi:hypothetical protein